MSRSFFLKVAAIVMLVFAPTARAAMVSTMANVDSVVESQGFYLAPVSQMYVAGDEAPAKVFEIIRPRGERITLGRLNTSCSCVRLEAPKATFEQGERAFVTLRNVRATPPNGQMYRLYVQIAAPVRVTLSQDTFFQSDRFRRAAPVQAGYRNASTPYAGYR